MALMSYAGGHRAEITEARRDAIMAVFNQAVAATLAAAKTVYPAARITDGWYKHVVDCLIDEIKLARPLP